MRKVAFVISFCLICNFLFAQVAGYSAYGASIRIEDANSDVLSEINKIQDKERKLVRIGQGVTQEGFNNICSKLKWIQKISIEDGGAITNLTAIKKLKNLESFRLSNGLQETISLAPLREMTLLKEIIISNTEISDADTLNTLINLERVVFENSSLKSLGFLSNLTHIKELTLSGVSHTFQNYDTLRNLVHLKVLYLSGNKQATTENLKVFSDFNTLEEVDVSFCPLTSIGFLYGSASNLKEFSAVGCKSIGNFDVLIRANKLKKVDLSKSSVKNVAFLKNKQNIKDLRIASTAVSSIAEISSCVNLENLDISDTQVDDLSALSMETLKKLNISHTNVMSLQPLASCINLVLFNCSYTNVSDLAGLENCINLNKINLGHTSITDISILYNAKKISQLIVDKDVPVIQHENLKKRSKLIIIDVVSDAPIQEEE